MFECAEHWAQVDVEVLEVTSSTELEDRCLQVSAVG